MNKRGQLFLIEVIVAVTVLIVMVSALFAIQTFSPPPSETNLRDRGERILKNLSEDEIFYNYFDSANYSYYVDNNTRIDPSNQTLVAPKLEVIKTIEQGLPAIAGFRGFVERFDTNLSQPAWVRLDIVNFEETIPRGTDIVSVEYYTPGYRGEFDQFKFTLFMWYEVS